MLKFFTRLERTRNFVLLLFAVLMVASLVLFYKPSQNTVGADLSSSTESAAKVAGEYVTVGELFRQKEAYSRFSQGRPYPAKLILDGIVDSRIARVEAARLGLTASDTEVASAIRERFKPEDGKAFDQQIYEQNVIQQSGSVSAFEESVRDELSANKLRAYLTAGLTVSDEEVLKNYQRSNTKFDVSYVAISAAELAQGITPSEADLQAYFDKNKAAYYINEPQKKIKYVFVNTAKIGEKMAIPEADLKAEYDKLPEERRNNGVLGQEIVLRIAKPEFDAQVLEKATQLVTRLRAAGASVTEEAFAEMAKGQSENAVSASNGGKLKGPVKLAPEKQSDPYQQLLTMKPGEITDPINYEGRYFILRRGNDVPKSFEDARQELEISMRNRRAFGQAAELAQKISDTLKQNKDVTKTAEQYAGEANSAVADMIRETGYVKPGDDVKDIGNSPQFEDGIAGLVNINDVGDKTPIQKGFAIPMLIDKKDPRDAELAEVKDRVLEAVKLEKAKASMEEIANQIAAGSTSAAALASAATAHGLKAEEQKSYILGSPLGKGPLATTNDALQNAIYDLKTGESTKTPIRSGDNFYIVNVNNRQDANMDDFAKERDSLMEQMLQRRRGEVFGDFMAATRQKMQTDGNITIYADALAKLETPVTPINADQ